MKIFFKMKHKNFSLGGFCLWGGGGVCPEVLVGGICSEGFSSGGFCPRTFDTEPVAMSTTFCALSVFLQRKRDFIVSAAWVMKVIPQVLPRIPLRNCGNSHQSKLCRVGKRCTAVKLDQKTTKMERQIDQLH